MYSLTLTAAPPPVHDASVKISNFDHPIFRNSGKDNDGVIVGSPGGDVAAAAPEVTAIVGPGGRADISPHAFARTGSRSDGLFRSSIGRGGDVAVAKPKVNAIVGAGGYVSVSPVADARTGDDGVAATVIHRNVPVPVAVPVETRRGYSYNPPPQQVARVVHAVPPPRPVIHAAAVVPAVQIVPARRSYSYTYSYSAPDGKHPQRDNSAYVNVQVN